MIGDICSLFELSIIPHDKVKRKLLYLSLSSDARKWFRPLDDEYRLDWEFLKKAFDLKYYSPEKLMMIIAIFITLGLILKKVSLRAWGRLKGSLVRIHVIINFYMRLPQHRKEFL
jgi:hypothetical protein